MAYNKFITEDGLVLIDLTADTVTANELLEGITAHDKSGAPIIGTAEANSAIPTEVSTEEEMTALLESGEVGGVYKYTGTSGTYENGALYVLEEETAESYSSRIDVYDSGVISTHIDLTAYEGQLWSVLHDVTLYAENGSPYTVTINAVNEVMLAGSYLDAVASDTISGVYDAYFTHSGGSGN